MQNLSRENEFYLHEIKNHFYINGFVLGLALKQRVYFYQWNYYITPNYQGLIATVDKIKALYGRC